MPFLAVRFWRGRFCDSVISLPVFGVGVAAVRTLVAAGLGDTSISCGFGALAELLPTTGLLQASPSIVRVKHPLGFQGNGIYQVTYSAEFKSWWLFCSVRAVFLLVGLRAV